MDPSTQLGFQFAKEISTQLIALSTGLLTLTITFTKEIFRAAPKRCGFFLPVAWAAHLISILFGIWTLMALTGTLMPVDAVARTLEFAANVRIPAAGQIIIFMLGTLFLVLYGLLSFRKREPEELSYRTFIFTPEQFKLSLDEQARKGWNLHHIVIIEKDQILTVFNKRPRKNE